MARDPFGTRLRSLRERAGMTQKQLADKVGTDQNHISRWERNVAVPELKLVEFLAAALAVSTEELLTGKAPKLPNSAASKHSDAGTVPKTPAGGSTEAAPRKWHEAQERVLLKEFREAHARAAKSLEEAEKWFAGLSLAERDRVGRRLNDPNVIGRYLQTPRTH